MSGRPDAFKQQSKGASLSPWTLIAMKVFLFLSFLKSSGSQCTRRTKPEGNNRSLEEFSVVIVPG